MFRTLARKFLPNPLDAKIAKAKKAGGSKILIGWNRGLGDIALGLYAIVHRIRQILPEASITFATRENLLEGFSMLEGVEAYAVAGLKRGDRLQLEEAGYDLVIENPSPTDWCRWQRGALTPRLQWNSAHEDDWRAFDLPDGFTYIGVQVSAETQYGLWRNWPMERWNQLFDGLAAMGSVKILLFGYGSEPSFAQPNIVDLRGKTNLFQLLSIVKNRCSGVVLPDSGISSMIYYLDEQFPLRHVSLWADADHGILKQNVPSPNPSLVSIPLIALERDLSQITAEQVMDALFLKKNWTPWLRCVDGSKWEAKQGSERVACLILAGGQGSRLGFSGPKGMFPLRGKSLFERHCEKIPASVPILIMTSPLNHEATVSFFQQQCNFGKEIHFFQQTTLPLLDERYNELEAGPNGNGCVFRQLVSSGLVKKLEERGIDTLSIIPVDNPLAKGVDPAFLSHHQSEKNELTIKCVQREKNEAMGMLCDSGGKIAIAEYIDLPQEQPDQSYGYLNQIAVSLDFVKKAAGCMMPQHWVRKKAVISGQTIAVWKREEFIFDAFHLAERAGAVCYAKEECYAPIKGPESIARAEQLIARGEP